MKSLFSSLISIAIALLLSGILVWSIGESPWLVYKVLFQSSFGSSAAIGYTIFYATPLIFTGLAVALAFHAGLFNIGCEGQLYMGAFAASLVGLYAPYEPGFHFFWLSLALLAAFVAGALWAAIPGFLKAFRGSHEVINTIMLNAIAGAILSYLTNYVFRNPNSQAIETPEVTTNIWVPSLSRIFPLPESSPANFSFFLALLTACAVYLFLWKTKQGFSLRAVGQNDAAARCSGISIRKSIIWAMALSGGVAGLVGANDILGYSHRFKDSFSSGYGFMGIAVALLGRNHPVGIILAALLFGALHNGSIALDLDTEKVSRDLVLIIEGIIIFSVAADFIFRRWIDRLWRKKV